MAATTLASLGLEEVPMPGDDHCFFNSVVHQLLQIMPNSVGFRNHVMQLRHEVVEFLQEQMYLQDGFMDSLYEKAIERRVPVVPYADEFLRKESAVFGYLAILDEDEWADYECIAAVIQIKGINIKVINSETGLLLDIGQSSLPCVYLVYCNGNHYNSVRPLIFSQVRVFSFIHYWVRS